MAQFEPGLAGYFAGQQAVNQGALQANQMTLGNLGILAQIQKMQQDKVAEQRRSKLEELISSAGGDISKLVPALSASPEGIKLLSAVTPLIKQQQEKALMDSVGNQLGPNPTPDQLRVAGHTLLRAGHAFGNSLITEADRREKIGQNEAAAKAMAGTASTFSPATATAEFQPPPQGWEQSTPRNYVPPMVTSEGSPSAVSHLVNDPYVGEAARALESQMRQTPPGSVPISVWETRIRGLEGQAQRAAQAELARGHAVDMKVMFPPNPAQESPVQTHTDSEGKVWEKTRGGPWRPAILPNGTQMTSGTAPAKAASQDETFDAIDKQIVELQQLIRNNEGLGTGTVGPKGLVSRVAETVSGLIPGNEFAPTPALSADSKKELIVANIRNLMDKGQLSKDDRQRIDNALGTSGLLTTAGNAIDNLESVRNFLKAKKTKKNIIIPTEGNAGKAKFEDFIR